MASTVTINYTRKFTNKLGDGSFESFELGGAAELDLGEVESLDAVNDAYDQMYAQFVANVEAKVLELANDINPKPDAQAKPEPAGSGDRLTSWVKKTVDENTNTIRKGATLPGERFSKPPAFAQKKTEPEVDTSGIVEGEAVSFEDVRVFLDNKQTKIGRTQRGTKFGMLRLGKKGEMPGDYVTGKSFDPDVTEMIEAVIDQEITHIDVYGYFEPRNNDPEVFDLVIQGLEPSSRG